MPQSVVAVTGLPGTGKTSVARRVADGLNLRFVSVGGIFRAMAQERGMSLEEFGNLAEKDPTIDRNLDKRVEEEARKGNVVLEGRRPAWICKENNIPAFKVRLEASEIVRAERVAKREGISVGRAILVNALRVENETRRYVAAYGNDLQDTSIYDMVIETENVGVDLLVRKIEMEAILYQK